MPGREGTGLSRHLTIRALEAVTSIARPAAAREGARGVVADGSRVTRAFSTLIHVCAGERWHQQGQGHPASCAVLWGPSRAHLTRAVDAITGVAGEALTGGAAVTAGKAPRAVPRSAGMSSILTGITRWCQRCGDRGEVVRGHPPGSWGHPVWGQHLRTHACPSPAGRYPPRHSQR